MQDMVCGERCRSKQHALQLITAVTKGSCRQVVLFLSTCHNSATVTDEFGRTALHVAASCGKINVVRWLLENRKCNLIGRDIESGWTCLHRALFYGHLSTAQLLIENEASLHARDKEGLTSLDIAMKDRLPHVEFLRSGLNDVCTWGDNLNFTLGHSNEQRKKNAEPIEQFRKENISIKQVVICQYHSVFLSTAGHVYTCGHGRGGRLGHGDEQTSLVPRFVKSLKDEVCVEVSASRDHTLFLTERGAIYSCGLNECQQLGIFPSRKNSLVPKQLTSKLLRGKPICGVCAQCYHSVVYTQSAVYTFGLNGGQLGHIYVRGDPYINQPQQVSALGQKDMSIRLVSASDAATVVTTSKGDVFALHEYQCRRIVSKWLDIVQVSVSGGHLDHRSDADNLPKTTNTALLVLLLNSSGKVFVWSSAQPECHRLLWVLARPLHVSQMCLCARTLAFVTCDGEAFTGTLPTMTQVSQTVSKGRSSSASLTSGLCDLHDAELTEQVAVTRIPMVHRATAITADLKARNFAVLQAQPNASLTEIPCVQPSQMVQHFKMLLDDADASDSIHDVILQVGRNRVACHSYILASRCEHFRNRLTSQPLDEADGSTGESVIVLTEISYTMFTQLLSFIYTDTCSLLTVGSWYVESDEDSLPHQTTKKDKQKSGKRQMDPVACLQEIAKKWGMKHLVKRLEAVKYTNGRIESIRGRQIAAAKLRFDMNNYHHLSDMRIICNDSVEISCHKCVLVARLEYFHSMLTSSWIEACSTGSISLPASAKVLTLVLNYLYTDDSNIVSGCNDIEFVCHVLVIADQLLCGRLKEICEVAIAARITLRTCCDLLEFSTLYNANQLKVTCQQFITINLSAVLEMRLLECLSEEVLDELSVYYRSVVPGMCQRVITPYAGWPSRSYLEQLESEAGETELSAHTPDVATVKSNKKKRGRTKSQSEKKSIAGSRPGRLLSTSSVVSSDDVEQVDNERRTEMEMQETASPDAEDQMNTVCEATEPAASAPHITAPGVVSLMSIIQSQQEEEEEQACTKHIPQNITIGKSGERMTRKPRRKLMMSSRSEGCVSSPSPEDIGTKPKAWTSNPWNTTDNVVESFEDLLISEEKQQQKTSRKALFTAKRSTQTRQTSPRVDANFSWGSPPTSSEVDQTDMTRQFANMASSPSTLSLTAIIRSEQEQLETFHRATNKPLPLIQIEEQAMQELLQQYRAASNNDDVLITVERVLPSDMATPIWAANQRHHH